MLLEEAGWHYYSTEAEFVKYFDRLRDTEMSFEEIESKLPQLEKYYFEMVIEGVFYVDVPTLSDLFRRWKNHRK